MSEIISQYIQHLAHILDIKHILKTRILNIFKINIWIADSFFTKSTAVTARLIFDCIQYLLCSKSRSHFKFC